jgi:phage-related protein
MAFPTFSPPAGTNVDVGSSAKMKPRVRTAGFGDGINSIDRSFSATFSAITYAEADTITGFFEGLAGYKPFWWTMPSDTTARKWIATEWDKTYGDAGDVAVSATFEEVFDPG